MSEEKLKVGLVGVGVLGGVMKKWLETHTNHTVLCSDPPKNMNDDLSEADVVFIQLHIITEADGSQDLTLLKSILAKLPNVPIFIRTTMKTGTCDALAKEFGKPIYFMPEFLTERTAYEDFCSQPMVFTAHYDLLKKVFPNKAHIIATSKEAEVIKYVHNVFGALKVTYFNAVYDYCEKNGCDFDVVRQGVLLSKYISPTHTSVPGPDGSFGYGGKCFPKDVKAFTDLAKGFPLYEILKEIEPLNAQFRAKPVKK